MFQFPGFASYTYVFSAGYPAYTGWVSPFGNARIKSCLPLPRALSQATTSFIASDCLGIHRARLVTWPYNPKQCFRSISQPIRTIIYRQINAWLNAKLNRFKFTYNHISTLLKSVIPQYLVFQRKQRLARANLCSLRECRLTNTTMQFVVSAYRNSSFV